MRDAPEALPDEKEDDEEAEEDDDDDDDDDEDEARPFVSAVAGRAGTGTMSACSFFTCRARSPLNMNMMSQWRHLSGFSPE